MNNVKKISVFRILSDGRKTHVGTLAENKQGIFFAYEREYINKFNNLSPFKLSFDTTVQLAARTPHKGLHGIFADSLPDGWGLLLQDRFFASQGLNPHQISPLQRLCLVGDTGIGALVYEPQVDTANSLIDLYELGRNAQQVFAGETTEVLQELLYVGSSGGARPKAQIYLQDDDFAQCSTVAQKNSQAWIVKFTSSHLPLAHTEGVLEAVYLTMAEQADLQPVHWRLLHQGEFQWLAVKRFDCTKYGRIHTATLCGLLDADFRMPSMDYSGCLKATKILCKSKQAAELQFRRMIFNLFACNQDEHTKNWSFLQDEQGNWQPSDAYDITFAPMRHNQHAMSFQNYGNNPPLKIIQELAEIAGYSSWQHAKKEIEKIVASIANFTHIAVDFGVGKTTVREIQNKLNQIHKDNSLLCN
ncbi:MAG: type II toxin-antitoxin system HipA family toxin [Cardiobacteriaceae bacterium]|nr:type II toxin-antitoxin system HipA family toxin [Cardiobacteriaceae bacterium]